MPPLIISIGQGGISPMRTYWEYNLEILREERRRRLGSKSRRKKKESASNIDEGDGKLLAPPGEGDGQVHPYLQHFYYNRQWTSPRWLCVDSEFKVINSLPHLFLSQQMKREWTEGRREDWLGRHGIKTHEGMGGCWGRGFFKCAEDAKEGRKKVRKQRAKATEVGTVGNPVDVTKGPSSSTRSILPSTLAAVRTHQETLDKSSVGLGGGGSFFVTHSLTGGTGSGVTSRVLEGLRDWYPKCSIYTYTLTPFVTTLQNGHAAVTDSTGPLHSYNSLLAMVYLQRYADGIIMRGNNDVMNEVKSMGNMKDVRMKDINDRIAGDVRGLLGPTWDGEEWGCEDLDVVLKTDVTRGDCKIVDLRCVGEGDLRTARSSTSTRVNSDPAEKIFGDMGKLASATVIKKDLEGRDIWSLNTHVIARGWGGVKGEGVKAREGVWRSLGRGYRWKGDEDFRQWTECRGGGGEKSVTVLSLRSTPASSIRNIITTGQSLYDARAYLHYYEREGVERDDWAAAFENSWRIVEAYEELFKL